MKKELKEKLETVVNNIDKLMMDPEIHIDYCIPEVETTSDGCSVNADPYIRVKYADDKFIERKIRLSDKYLQHTAQEITDLVTFSIEQFKEEMGAIRYDQG